MTTHAHDPSSESQYRSPINLSARVTLHSRFSVNQRGWFPWVFDQFDLPPRCRILEVGCGTGTLWKANQDRIPAGWRLVLTDMSEGMLAAVRRKLEGLHQLELTAAVDAQALPFDDGSFDAVIANHMLYHVPDLDSALSDVKRVLKPGGTLFAATNGERNMREFHELLASCVMDASMYLEQAVADRFSLQNGGARLGRWFARVETRTYDDALVVTEVEPLVAYAQSLSTGSKPVLSGERLDRFTSAVTDEIRRDGAFRISKSVGMFVARKSGAC